MMTESIHRGQSIQQAFDQIGMSPTMTGFAFAVIGYAVVWAKANRST